jgi:hypothetical protein
VTVPTAAKQFDLWVGHGQPERPLAYGAWLCCCEPCAFALRAAAESRPGLPIVLKTGMDRFVVAAAVAVDARWHGSFERLLRVPDDWLREVFVGSGADVRQVRQRNLRGSVPLPCECCAHGDDER